MAFKVFEKGSAPPSSVPSVSIQKRGFIGLNRAAHELLDSAKAVVFLWDEDRKLIGLRPADIADPNAHELRPVSRSSKKDGPVGAAAGQFTRFIGLDTSEGRRWTPTMEGDALVIDLNQPGTRVHSPRTRGQEQNDGAAAAATAPN
jgi:hypothetical protein